MPEPMSSPPQDAPPPPGRADDQSLRRQLTWRLLAVFLVVAVFGNLVALMTYRIIVHRAQAVAADNALLYIRNGYQQMHEGWSLNAQEVKAQIDYMRLFADDPARSWLRLRAYFASLEGRVGKFPAGVVFHRDGTPAFSFGREGATLSRHLDGDRTPVAWYFGKDHRTTYALIRVPLWLGDEGNGHMTLMQPLNAGVLRVLAPPDVILMLVIEGRIVAGIGGADEVGRAIKATYQGPLLIDGRAYEQRVLPAFGDDPAAPCLVMRQLTREPLSMPLIILASTTLLASLTLLLWLVIGRWAREVTDRVSQLSRAAGLFAREHAMSDELHQALDSAGSAPDEIADVARSSRELMQSVLRHDQEQFGYLQTLDILEEGVVEIAADGRYLRASPGWARLIGRFRHTTDDLIHESIHPEDQTHFRQQLNQLFSGEKTSLTGRIRLKRDDAKDLWVEYRFVPGVAAASGVTSLRGVLRDITQSYLLEQHITHMALHDALTELPNRVLLEDRAKIALRTAQRKGNKVALGFMDLDHFKHVNDQHGHKVGDGMLVALSHNLRQHLRSGDTLARWGGDEFVVLLTDLASLDDARDVMAKLSAACEKPVVIDDNEFNATFSMGGGAVPGRRRQHRNPARPGRPGDVPRQGTGTQHGAFLRRHVQSGKEQQGAVHPEPACHGNPRTPDPDLVPAHRRRTYAADRGLRSARALA
jgi:diguanylate cyclase (GGDEF)-like protein